MRILSKNISKKFDNQKVLKNLNLTVEPQSKWLIAGENGAGKSTFLKILAGYISPSQGEIIWHFNNSEIDRNQYYNYLSFASPALQFPEQASLLEIVYFQHKLKPFLVEPDTVLDLCLLKKHGNKAINKLSSGMQQRLKTGLAILSNCPVLFLDEPCTNLDIDGVKWYKDLIENFAKNKTIVVASNQAENEAHFTESVFVVNNR